MKALHLFILLLVVGIIGYVFFQQTEGIYSVQPTEDTNASDVMVTSEDRATTSEQLLEKRRVLADAAYRADASGNPTPEMIEAVRNPSPELLQAIVEEFVAGTFVGVDIEREFAIVDDWLAEPLEMYFEQNDVFALAGIKREPLPEPDDYRVATATVQDQQEPFFRFELSTDQERPMSIYAVDSTGTFSGIVDIHEELRLPFSEIKNVSPSSFINKGIQVDANAPSEFTIMMKGHDFGVFPVHYTYYSEDKTNNVTRQILTTANMLASATVVIEDNRVSLYKWRVDYDGDGIVDFLVSHNGISEEQATEVIDFVIETKQFSLDNQQANIREQLIDFLSRDRSE